MTPSPRSPRSPDPPVETNVDHPSTEDDDEGTPIVMASHDRGRNYQATHLPTHQEASTSPHSGDPRQDSTATGRSAAKSSLSEIDASTKRRAARNNHAMRRASDRSELSRRGSGKPASQHAASARGLQSTQADDSGNDAGRESTLSMARRRRRARRWWRRTMDKYGSVELDNKGSVARDHLALERTFLAWLRTSLSFASIGIAITQLFRLNTTITDREGLVPSDSDASVVRLRQMGKPLGATFLGIAILVLLVGSRRYFESQYWIIQGKFPASRGSVILVTFVAIALVVASLAIVLVVSPTQFET